MKITKFMKFRPQYFCTVANRRVQHQLHVNEKNGGSTYSVKNGKYLNTDPFLYSSNANLNSLISAYDSIIVGAGHNGLVCANYLAKNGKKVLVLEKRHQVGGCAVTEELLEGYKFSRCSYVLSLFRKKIIDELFGDEFDKKIKLYKRNPKGLTPTKEVGKFLLRRSERDLLKKEISKFSVRDAERIDDYDNLLNKFVKIVDPLIDMPPPNFSKIDKNTIAFVIHLLKHMKNLPEFYHFLTSSAEYYLDKYFESDILKGTFATDAVIGAMKSPKNIGSAYVLLHHVMGTLDEEGSWFYVEGGNGAISSFLADEAIKKGVTIALNCPVDRLITVTKGKKSVEGVVAGNLTFKSNNVVTNCDLYTTYFKLLNQSDRENIVSESLIKSYESIDYTSPVFKINLVVDKLPMFKCLEDKINDSKYNGDYNKLALDYLTGTIHMNSDSINSIHKAYNDAISGSFSKHPIIEMTIPSVLDKTLVPRHSKHHVIGLFCQYSPMNPDFGSWNEESKKLYAKRIYSEINEYCPGFSESIIYEDILSPSDLESEFSIRGGNIFHGSMDLNTIFFCRPFYGGSSYEQPILNLYSCSSGMHPGGGVMGAVGRNCALTVLNKN